ncbi:MAG TPA: NAD(P)-dependent oxidoreductase [Candidatus Paceibacterota bacterium]|jgi:phosphoglycerate dehydrogenase-like enzyme|nr:NAD(P)-dependent oxidoreductase [Candidatus Paceibacterota bacterium]
MKGKILITDSLFIFPEHEKMLTDAGYEIERLDKPKASEEELVEAVKGKVGYILGGIEHITEKIIDAADSLKVITFTGIGYKDLIPAWEYATKKGIAITNTPDAPTHAVAEWALTVTLAMNRGVFDLGRGGQKDFMTTKGLEGLNIGIVGFGRIGRRIAEMIKPFRPGSVSYYSKHHHESDEQRLGASYKELDELMTQSDVIFVCVSKDAGENFLNTKELSVVKNGSLLVSFMHPGIINEDALFEAVKSGNLRVASDVPFKNPAFKDFPLSAAFCFNGSNAFNTAKELKITSDTATQSILNILETGKDEYRVN